jgi:hypothetical protein
VPQARRERGVPTLDLDRRRPTMNKLKLQIDNLKVESFETSGIRTERGTVLGASVIEEATPVGPCPNFTEITGPCCDHTLMLSCVQTNCMAECTSFDADVCLG